MEHSSPARVNDLGFLRPITSKSDENNRKGYHNFTLNKLHEEIFVGQSSYTNPKE